MGMQCVLKHNLIATQTRDVNTLDHQNKLLISAQLMNRNNKELPVSWSIVQALP